MARPTIARIDLGAIKHNLGVAKALAPGARALAVVKANAYGHGAVAVARALSPQADAFAVACTEEALELRESGITKPIVLLEGPFEPAEIGIADRENLGLVVHNRAQLDWVRAAHTTQPLWVWLKMDSGMHRIGFPPEEYTEAYGDLRACDRVGEIVLMTHLARADEPGHPSVARQLEVFETRVHALPGARSAANSAALIGAPRAHGHWLRPGIMLYGATPFGETHNSASQLRPAMHLESRIISVRELSAGEAIGYGGRFVCAEPTRVGVVAAGYADGYPRHARDGTPVAVNQELTRIIGRVSMDMLTVDLSNQPHARTGDPVQLWGDIVSANAVAEASGTIAYQLFTSLSARVPLRHENG